MMALTDDIDLADIEKIALDFASATGALSANASALRSAAQSLHNLKQTGFPFSLSVYISGVEYVPDGNDVRVVIRDIITRTLTDKVRESYRRLQYSLEDANKFLMSKDTFDENAPDKSAA